MTMRERKTVYIRIEGSPIGFKAFLDGKGHATKYPLSARAIIEFEARGMTILRLIEGRAVEWEAHKLISLYGLR